MTWGCSQVSLILKCFGCAGDWFGKKLFPVQTSGEPQQQPRRSWCGYAQTAAPTLLFMVLCEWEKPLAGLSGHPWVMLAAPIAVSVSYMYLKWECLGAGVSSLSLKQIEDGKKGKGDVLVCSLLCALRELDGGGWFEVFWADKGHCLGIGFLFWIWFLFLSPSGPCWGNRLIKFERLLKYGALPWQAPFPFVVREKTETGGSKSLFLHLGSHQLKQRPARVLQHPVVCRDRGVLLTGDHMENTGNS